MEASDKISTVNACKTQNKLIHCCPNSQPKSYETNHSICNCGKPISHISDTTFSSILKTPKFIMAQHYFFSSLLPFLSLLAIFSNVISQSKPVMAVTLHTDSRWIVNEAGQRVKLACVNWVSHMDPMVAEGLNKQPLDAISKRIVSMGFNCVRFTWPLYLVTNDSLASLTVRQSFQRLGLSQYIAGIQAKNPSIIDVPLITAFRVR